MEGDCSSAQRKSTGVLNFESETAVQMFRACDRGRISQIKLAVPFVEPGYNFEYALLRADYTPIAGGEFTHENTTDGELLLTFDEGSVRKDEASVLENRVSCREPEWLSWLMDRLIHPLAAFTSMDKPPRSTWPWLLD